MGEPVDPDEIAEEAPIDPTPREVDEYRELIGDVPAERESPEPASVEPDSLEPDSLEPDSVEPGRPEAGNPES